MIFIPVIHGCFTAHTDEAFQKAFDDLGYALAKRFPNLVQYAQPAEFWLKYREKILPTSPSKQNKQSKRKVKEVKTLEKAKANSTQIEEDIVAADEMDEDLECDSVVESDFCSDDELPLASKKYAGASPQKRVRLSDAEIPMEYLFNPNI